MILGENNYRNNRGPILTEAVQPSDYLLTLYVIIKQLELEKRGRCRSKLLIRTDWVVYPVGKT